MVKRKWSNGQAVKGQSAAERAVFWSAWCGLADNKNENKNKNEDKNKNKNNYRFAALSLNEDVDAGQVNDGDWLFFPIILIIK